MENLEENLKEEIQETETEKQIDALQSSYPDQMAIVCADIGSDESVLKASNNIKNLCQTIFISSPLDKISSSWELYWVTVPTTLTFLPL